MIVKNTKTIRPNGIKTDSISVDGSYHFTLKNEINFSAILRVITSLQDKFQKFSEQIENLENKIIDVEKETKAVRSRITIELDSVKYGQQDNMFWISIFIFVVVLLVVPLYFCVLVKTGIKTQNKENKKQDVTMERSIAVVSFSKANEQLHKTISNTVIKDTTIKHYISLGGVRNVSSVELISQVCFVFVDRNERNIILETEVDISKTRSDFVENLVRQGRTDVVVIYCQHKDSRDLDTLYHRGLGNVNEHHTLRQLKRQNRVLSIDQNFSVYQTKYMEIFLRELNII